MKYVFISLLFCALIGSSFAQPANIPVSNTTLFDGEPYLAVNPANHNNMVIAWMSYVPNPNVPILEQIGIRVRSSFDGGRTWGNEIMMPHISPKFHSADVSMAFHDGAFHDGTLYIEYIDYHERPDSGVIVVLHSTDGGKSWSAPVKAFDLYDNDDKPIDRPWMVIDNSGTATDGTIYITTKPAPWDPTPNRPYLKYSTDNGNTWSKIDTVDGGDYPTTLINAPMVSPAVSADGVFYATYVSWNLKKSLYPRFTLASSKDFGKTYTRTTIAVVHDGSGGDTLSKLGHHLTVDPTNAKNLLVTWIDPRDGDPDIYSSISHDGGLTWSEALRINDDPKNNGVWQDLVWANYSDNGKCVISWRDRRNGDSTQYAKGSDIYFAVSTDGGTTFGKNIRISDKTAKFNQVLNGSGNDFHSNAIVNDSICLTWSDVRTGKLTIYFAKASLSDGIAKVIDVSGSNIDRLSVNPNPATHSVTIGLKLSEEEPIELSLYDISGKEIWRNLTNRANNFSETLDLRKFSAGVYTISAKTSKETLTKKLSIEH